MTIAPPDPALLVEGFFDAATSTVGRPRLDPASRRRAVVDSVPDPDAGRGLEVPLHTS